MQKQQIEHPTYVIGSVGNALHLLQALRDGGALRLTDAARELNVAPSTAHRLLSMLVNRGFAVQDERGRITRVPRWIPAPRSAAGPASSPTVADHICSPCALVAEKPPTWSS
ncbi:helix-turn-helix domain-containing protein [Mycolicibacterium sphagni]|uniref:helix-turn-helix domain-containing protein n=1 Tax=Mycolicibacterium sphagni TaxID=1786 RepID=UPI0021F2B074|nr:helix-turn-helix domain-containing protein [Mycolicibacterium sphagni]